MNEKEILSHVDHTLLKATASWEEIRTLCDEAVKYGTASVCVPSYYVKKIRETYPDLTICTVVGFPLGNGNSESKIEETIHAIADGADEIDMVINIGAVKNKDYDFVTEEIAVLKETVEDKVLKVIVETCYLTEEEKIRLCECVAKGGADYIKTSTGFGPAGADLKDIALFKEHIGPDVKIKAAGGIRTREDIEAFLAAGADRIGASGAIKALYGE